MIKASTKVLEIGANNHIRQAIAIDIAGGRHRPAALVTYFICFILIIWSDNLTCLTIDDKAIGFDPII